MAGFGESCSPFRLSSHYIQTTKTKTKNTSVVLYLSYPSLRLYPTTSFYIYNFSLHIKHSLKSCVVKFFWISIFTWVFHNIFADFSHFTAFFSDILFRNFTKPTLNAILPPYLLKNYYFCFIHFTSLPMSNTLVFRFPRRYQRRRLPRGCWLFLFWFLNVFLCWMLNIVSFGKTFFCLSSIFTISLTKTIFLEEFVASPLNHSHWNIYFQAFHGI